MLKPTPPGDTIIDIIEEHGIRPTEAAASLGLSMQQWERLVVGDLRITPGLAAMLEHEVGMPADFWLRRDATYFARAHPWWRRLRAWLLRL